MKTTSGRFLGKFKMQVCKNKSKKNISNHTRKENLKCKDLLAKSERCSEIYRIKYEVYKYHLKTLLGLNRKHNNLGSISMMNRRKK